MKLSLTEFLQQCLSHLQEKMPAQINMYASRLTAADVDGKWVIFAENSFIFGILNSYLKEEIEKFHQKYAPKLPILDFQEGCGDISISELLDSISNSVSVDKSDESKKTTPTNKDRPTSASKSVDTTVHKEKTVAKTSKISTQHKNDTGLNKKLTFSNLVVGGGNQLAYAVAMSVVEQPGKQDYNPLFLYGGSGLGKTHLAHAIGNAVVEKYDSVRVRCIYAQDFMDEYVSAIKNGNIESFKKLYKNLDLLILDDVQFFAKKEKTIEEFFHLFNSLFDESKQIVLTCDSLPKDLEEMPERIISRFSSGYTVEIEVPELEMRMAILEKKAELSAFRMPKETAHFIAEKISSSVRALEGALNKLRQFCKFHTKSNPDVKDAKEALKDILSSDRKSLTIEEIQKTVATYYQIQLKDLNGKSRKRDLVRPRQIAMRLCKELTSCSLVAIGKEFGGRDHSTVLHACDNIDDLIVKDSEVQLHFNTLKNMLR